MGIVLHITAAALAVLGLYFLLKVIFSLVFRDETVAAVIIKDTIKLKSLDILLDDASRALFFTRGKRLAVFVTEEVWERCDGGDRALAREVAESFGANLYII
jgi:Na+-transporting NADH:ubiquinone oxidoreductase subunit NqrD